LTIRAAVCFAAALFVGAVSADAGERLAQETAPLRVRNTLPTAQLYGLPRPLGAEMLRQGTEVTFGVDLGSNFSSDFEPEASAFFDGETTVFSLGLRAPLGRRMEWGFELPYVLHSAGYLDGFLETFHDVAGLPDGGRDGAPKNRLDYLVAYRGTEYASFRDRQHHLGDVRGWLGYQLHRSAARTLGLRALLKLPTGRVEDLSGSDGTDGALWLEYSDRALLSSLGLSLSLMGGAVILGDGDLAPDAQKDVALVGHLGLQYAITRRVALMAQLDTHGQLLDTGVPQAADAAVQGTLGGRWSMSREFWMDLGIVENLRSQTASDVVFQFLLGARF
jgi:hypothetical protein